VRGDLRTTKCSGIRPEFLTTDYTLLRSIAKSSEGQADGHGFDNEQLWNLILRIHNFCVCRFAI
jgi:hypothetical protein